MNVVRAFVAALMLAALSVHASVVIVGTRVVYPGGARDVSVRLLNRGERPALIQAWIDRGDPNSKPDNVSVPFSLSPTLARIDPDKGQVLRLVYTGEPLPQDKESIFWLNMLEIPPKPADSENANYLQFALRTRIKLFYRPKQIKSEQRDAITSMQWRLLRDGEKWSLEAKNPSPYFISFTGASIRADANAVEPAAIASVKMVAPGDTERFDLTDIKPGMTAGSQMLLRAETIDDFGALVVTDTQIAIPDDIAGPPRDVRVAKPPPNK
jgi:P pilus assembly chaperone PapD